MFNLKGACKYISITVVYRINKPNAIRNSKKLKIIVYFGYVNEPSAGYTTVRYKEFSFLYFWKLCMVFKVYGDCMLII